MAMNEDTKKAQKELTDAYANVVKVKQKLTDTMSEFIESNRILAEKKAVVDLYEQRKLEKQN
jgi:hypothetical protein